MNDRREDTVLGADGLPHPIRPMSNQVLSILGLFLCTFLFYFIAILLRHTCARNQPRALILSISNKAVSSIQAIISTVIGAIITMSCRDHIIEAKHPYADTYPWFILGYGIYDTWSMYYVHVNKIKHHTRTDHVPFWAGIKHFARERTLMILHHVFLLVIGFPVVAARFYFVCSEFLCKRNGMYLRNGRGDFILGCFFLCEFSTPFVSLRAVLHELNKQNSIFFLINGILMIISFLCCRILIFPFMYWSYARQADVSIWTVPRLIPAKCSLFSAAVLGLQLYWIGLMLHGATRVIASKSKAKDLDKAEDENVHETIASYDSSLYHHKNDIKLH